MADIAAAAIFAEACAFVVTFGFVLLLATDDACDDESDTDDVGCDEDEVTVLLLFMFWIELFDWILAKKYI